MPTHLQEFGHRNEKRERFHNVLQITARTPVGSPNIRMAFEDCYDLMPILCEESPSLVDCVLVLRAFA
jgi:hypothetical protein